MGKIIPDNRKLLKALGDAICRRRLSKSMSQQDLADGALIHRTYLSDVERGMRNITLSTLENIAKALDTTSASLLLQANEMIDSARASQSISP